MVVISHLNAYLPMLQQHALFIPSNSSQRPCVVDNHTLWVLLSHSTHPPKESRSFFFNVLNFSFSFVFASSSFFFLSLLLLVYWVFFFLSCLVLGYFFSLLLLLMMTLLPFFSFFHFFFCCQCVFRTVSFSVFRDLFYIFVFWDLGVWDFLFAWSFRVHVSFVFVLFLFYLVLLFFIFHF